jgi:hypothetical protein
VVYERDGGYVCVEVGDEPRIDAAVTSWLDSGGSRDSLLDLTLIDGSEYRVIASHVVAWSISSPESRQRFIEHQAAMRDERAAAGGDWEDS